MTNSAKNTICLSIDGNAKEEAQLYAQTIPNSFVGAMHRTATDYPMGKRGDVLTVE